MPQRHEFVLGFFLGIALSVLCALLTPLDFENFGPFSEQMAAWVQAIGSVLAILAAYWISHQQHKRFQDTSKQDAYKKAKVLAYFFGPLLKTLDSDVERLILICRRYKVIGARDFKAIESIEHVLFRPLWSIEYLLNNAHTIPGPLSSTIPQLLGMRAAVGETLLVIVEQGKKHNFIPGGQFANLLLSLNLMKKLIDEAFSEIKEVHDTPLSDLLKMFP